jgi:hypothetical protein
MFKLYSVRDAESAVIPVLDPETKKPVGGDDHVGGSRAREVARARARQRPSHP